MGLPQQIGRYQVGRVLGRGGFATVVKAFDEGLRSDVAIKILDAQFIDDDDISQRFLNEGQLLRRVSHINVVAIHDLGRLEDGRQYYVMPFASGGMLSDRIPKGPGLVDTDDLGRVIDALVGGLGALHKADIVHRDIKPGNVLIAGAQGTELAGATNVRRGLLGPDETLMICDLGLAKVMDNKTSIASEPAKATVLGGSMHFQAPEQSQLGAAITEATDVYASSGVIWNLLTGSPPPPPADLEVSLVGVPPQWQGFFEKGLAARAEQRYRTIGAWGAAAHEALGSAPAANATGFTPSVSGAICPYKGLAAFQPEDAEFFFGRERLIDELTARLQTTPTLVIGGSSGSGKSSLMRAGLLSALAKGALPGSQGWKTILFAPGRNPLASLQRQLEQLPPPSETVGSGVVLAIDQFEEIFTGAGDPAEFIALLAQTSHDHLGRLRTVIAVRADFYGACSEHPWLAEAINRNSVLVGPLGRSELRAAIEGPARKAGLALEPGLVDRILEQAPDDAGALPLVAHALMETWLRRRNDLLTVNGLEAAGGVGGAIAKTADEAYDALGEHEQGLMRTLFLDLVNAGAGSPDTRRRIPMDEVRQDPKMTALAERLADARLLTIDSATVEIAHEALITTWPRFRTWIDQGRDDLRLRERVDTATEAWMGEDEDPGLLYRGTALATAIERKESARFSLNQQRFLQESQAVEQAEQDRETAQAERRQKVRRLVIAGLSVVTALALAASVAAVIGLQRAQDNADAAERSLLDAWATQTDTMRDDDPITALMLAAEAVVRDDGSQARPQDAMVEARLALANRPLAPEGQPIPVGGGKSISLNSPGTMLAIGSRSGQVSLISVASRNTIASASLHTQGVESTAFSPDGKLLVTSDARGEIWLWDIEPLDPDQSIEDDLLPIGGGPLVQAGSPVWSLAFSPSGDAIAAATENGNVWSVPLDGGSPEVLFSTQEDLLSVAYSPDGDSLAFGSGQGTTRLLDLGTGTIRHESKAHTSDVWQMLFTPDGDGLISVSTSTVAHDVTTGEVLGTLFENADGEWVKAIALLSNGSVVGGTNLGTLRISDVPDTMTEFTMSESLDLKVGHEVEITDGALTASADGTLVASLSGDGDVRLWSAPEQAPALVTTVDHDVYGADQNLAGTHVALGGDGMVTIVDLATSETTVLSGHDGPTFGIAYTDNSLVTGDSAGMLRRYDLNGTLLAEVKAHESRISGLEAGLAGDWLVSVADDGSIKFWDSELTSTADADSLMPRGATSVAIAPDGEYIGVSGAGGHVQMWNRDGSRKGSLVTIDNNTLWDLAFSPDGKLLATASANEEVQVLRTSDLGNSNPTPIHVFRPQSRGAVGVEFGKSSGVLYTSNRSGEVRLWNATEGIPNAQLGPALIIAESDVWALATSPNAESVIAAGAGGQVFLIDFLDLGRSCELTELAADQQLLDSHLGGQKRLACEAPGGGG